MLEMNLINGLELSIRLNSYWNLVLDGKLSSGIPTDDKASNGCCF